MAAAAVLRHPPDKSRPDVPARHVTGESKGREVIFRLILLDMRRHLFVVTGIILYCTWLMTR